MLITLFTAFALLLCAAYLAQAYGANDPIDWQATYRALKADTDAPTVAVIQRAATIARDRYSAARSSTERRTILRALVALSTMQRTHLQAFKAVAATNASALRAQRVGGAA